MDNKKVFEYPVWRAIFSLGLPALVSVFVMILYNMTDMYFVGFLHDYAQVAAVSLVGPVFSLMMACSMLLGNGGCTMIAQYLGAGETQSARGIMSLCAWASVLCGIIVTAVCFLFCDPLLNFLGANEEMYHYAKGYMLVLALGAPLMLLRYAVACLIRGEGAVLPGLYEGLISTGANIVLDPIFILVFGWGIVGAAAATVLANGIGMCFLLLYAKRHKMLLNFDLHAAQQQLHGLGHVIALGVPNAASNLLSGLASTFSNRLLVQYGTSAVAAMAAAGKVTMVVSLMQMGICMGVQPLMAYCYGGNALSRLWETVRKLLTLTVVLGLTLGAAGILLGRELVGLFVQDEAVIVLGQQMANLQLISAPFIGIFYIANNFLQATGRAGIATVSSILRQGVLLIPLLYVLEWTLGLNGITLAHVGADFLSIFIAGIAALNTSNQIKKGAISHEKIC